MTFQPEMLPQFLVLFHQSKERIRNMEGCRHLELWQDADAPHVCTTFSIWDSQEHLDAYRNSELFGQIWPSTKSMFSAKPMAFSVYQAAILP